MDTAHPKPGRVCQVCGHDRLTNLRRAALVGPDIAALIQKATGAWSEEGWICVDDLKRFSHQAVESLLTQEKGELSTLEKEVLESLKQNDILAHNPDEEMQTNLNFGDRLADRIADFGGSWSFIILFGVVFACWILLNSVILITGAFDPYPYIFMNLILSMLAAIQAPVIMMSQNRQETRDRLHMGHDYQVNLKAELEIRQLHQKIDHLISHQWERMVKIQEVQMELINEMRDHK